MSRPFKVSFGTDNEAFQPEPSAEVARILRQIAARIEGGASQGTIQDHNGNLVGDFHLGDFT